MTRPRAASDRSSRSGASLAAAYPKYLNCGSPSLKTLSYCCGHRAIAAKHEAPQLSCKKSLKNILSTLTHILAASSSKVQFVQVKPQPVSNYRALLVAEVVYRLDQGHSVCPPRCHSFKHRVHPLTRAGHRIPIHTRARCLRCMPKGTR